jgi:putative flippase GtrA
LPLAELRERFGRQPLLAAAAHAPADARGQLACFAGIGALSGVAYLMLFALLRVAGTAQEANLAALLITTVATTAANRRWTFRMSGQSGAGLAQRQGLLVGAVGLALTSGALALLHAVAPAAPRPVEIAVLVTATAVGTVVRFLLFRLWIFRPARSSGGAARPAAVPTSRVAA